MAVSKLIASGLNRTAVNNSLVMLKNYAMEDKGMKVGFKVLLFMLVLLCPVLSCFILLYSVSK